MTATDFVAGFIIAAKPTRIAVRHDLWARLFVENCAPLPFVPFPSTPRTFYGVAIGPRLQSGSSVCDTESPK